MLEQNVKNNRDGAKRNQLRYLVVYVKGSVKNGNDEKLACSTS